MHAVTRTGSSSAKVRLSRPIADRVFLAIEWPFKHALFGCQRCGQCLLSQTGMVCPMNCPKGLRNGPCGGTVEGRCEVYADRPCVWMRIHEKSSGAPRNGADLHPPFDVDLFNTSSYWNLLAGTDRATRLARTLPEALRTRRKALVRTESRFERLLRSGQPVVTTELRCPRTAGDLPRARKEIESLLPLVDAMTTTSNHGGMPAFSTLELSREIARRNGCAIPTVCARDVVPSSFVQSLLDIEGAGLHDVFCVTGDWPARESREPVSVEESQRRAFRMDATQMICEARSLGTLGQAAFGSLPANTAPPRLFVGGAINPNSFPLNTVVKRLEQKTMCGVDYVFTQAVCNTDVFMDFLRAVERAGLRERLFLMASVPVVGSVRGAEILRGLPGVRLPVRVFERFERTSDVSGEGSAWALEIVNELAGKVDGFHIMNFGMPLSRMHGVLEHVRQGLLSPASRYARG